MTTYLRADIQHVSRGVWRAYIPRLDDFAEASSQPKLEHEVYRVCEEAYGLRGFVITWNQV